MRKGLGHEVQHVLSCLWQGQQPTALYNLCLLYAIMLLANMSALYYQNYCMLRFH
jgi:hypothetical protein